MASLSLPTIAGAILLPDITLFPHGALPLHIFEPRYREMLTHALEGDCFFCVGTLLGEETTNPADCVAPVGTIGLIRAARELPDGRSEVLLHGVCRIHFTSWRQGSPYPYAEIKPFRSIDIPEEEVDQAVQRLHHAVHLLLERLPEEINTRVRALLARTPDPFTAADAIAQQFISDPAMRKILLEEPEVATRIEILSDYLAQLEV